MTDFIFWNFQDDDSTENLNYRVAGIWEPGLYRGFDAVLDASLNLRLIQDGATGFALTLVDKTIENRGVIVTNQGVVIQRNNELLIPISAGDASFPRFDMIILEHEYVFVQGGSSPLYQVIEGTPAAVPSFPNPPNPEITVVLGILFVPANTTGLTGPGVIYVKSKLPGFAGNTSHAFLDQDQTFEELNTFDKKITAGDELEVDGKITAHNELEVDLKTTLHGDLEVDGAVEASSTITATDKIKGLGELEVVGLTTLADAVMGKTFSLKKDTNIISPSLFQILILPDGNSFDVDADTHDELGVIDTSRPVGTLILLNFLEEVLILSTTKLIFPSTYPVGFEAVDGEAILLECINAVVPTYKIVSTVLFNPGIENLQAATGEDTDTPDYANENFITDGDSHNVAIGKLDTQAKVNADDIDNIEADWIAAIPDTSDSGSGAWTVDNPLDIDAFKYKVIGKTMFLSFNLSDTTVVAASLTNLGELRFKLPNSHTLASNSDPILVGRFIQAANIEVMWIEGEGGSDFLRLRREGLIAWVDGTNNIQVAATLTLNIA